MNHSQPRSALFLNSFDGPGRPYILDLILSANLVPHSAADRARPTIDERSWPSETGGIHVLGAPVARDTWSRQSRALDLAVVILRDPRDLVALRAARAVRSPEASVANLSDREQLLLAMAWMKNQERMLRSWAGRSSNAELVVSYESAIEDEAAFLERLAAHLGSGDIGDRAGDRLARDPDDSVGAWRHAFDADTANAFENCLPGLVVDLGYAPENDWFDTATPARDDARRAKTNRSEPRQSPVIKIRSGSTAAPRKPVTGDLFGRDVG